MTNTILDFLVENIKRLPVIASQDQEFWLAATLSANDALQEGLLIRPCPADLTHQVRACFEHARYLHQQAARITPDTPALRQFVTEALHARKHITTLRTSKILEHLTSLPAGGDAVTRVFRIAQTLAVLPETVLASLATYEGVHHDYPSSQHILQLAAAIPPDDITAGRSAATQAARDALITGYVRYALRVARKYVSRGLEYEDLVQEASIGLITATEKYDYLNQPRFATFATTWMWQHMTRAIANDSRLIRLPVHLNQKLDQVREALQQALEKHERKNTSPVPLATTLKRIGHDPDDTQPLLGISAPPLAFDEHLPGLGCSLAAALITTPFHDGNEVAPSGTSLTRVLSALPPVQEKVLRLRFGIDGPEHTLEQIGISMGVTRERIRQIEKAALEWLRSPAARAKFHNKPTSTRREPYMALRARQRLATALSRSMQDGAWNNHHDQSQEDHIEAVLTTAFGSRQTNVRQPVTIKGQLLDAFGNTAAPLHTRTLAARIRAALPLEDHQETTLYSVMIGNPDLFTLLGNGVFMLTSRNGHANPVLPCCPSLRPDGALTSDGLEAITAAARAALTPAAVITTAVRNLGITPPGADWYRHNIARLLFALGITDRVPSPHDAQQPIRHRQPDNTIMLAAVTERVSGMTSLWQLIATLQPVTSYELAKSFAQHYPLGEYDTPNRLSLLWQLGALHRVEDGTFILTDHGWHVTNNLASTTTGTPTIIETYLDEHERENQYQELDDLFTNLTQAQEPA
jgi:RNA polymerase sigma factor (sigma-70 family)